MSGLALEAASASGGLTRESNDTTPFLGIARLAMPGIRASYVVLISPAQ
jgi:hypothetical protein